MTETRDTEGWAIVAFVLGLLSLLGAGIGPGFVVGVAAASTTRDQLFGGLLIAGVVTALPVFVTLIAAANAQRRIKQGAGGAGLAKAGVILAVLGLATAVVAIAGIYMTASSAESTRLEGDLDQAPTTTSSSTPDAAAAAPTSAPMDQPASPPVAAPSGSIEAACEMMSMAIEAGEPGDLVARALALGATSGNSALENDAVEAIATAPGAGELDLSVMYEHCEDPD